MMGDNPASADAYLLLLPNEPYCPPAEPFPAAPPGASPQPAPEAACPPAGGDRYSAAQPLPWAQARGSAVSAEEPRPPAPETRTSFQFWWEHEIDPVLHSLREFFR